MSAPLRTRLPWLAPALLLLLAACGPSLPPSVDGVTVRTPAYMLLDSRVQATARVSSQGNADTRLLWTSSDENVVLIDGNGLMMAVSYGSATITATSLFAPDLSDSTVVEVIDDPWSGLPNMPFAVSRTAGVFTDGRFFVLGGESAGGQRVGRVQVYDPEAGSWSSDLPIMPQPVSNLCAVALDGGIYVPGGALALNQASTAMRRLDVADGSWALLEDDPLPAQRIGHTCALAGGRIYLFGGYDPINSAVSLEPWVFDPAAPAGERWTTGLNRPPQDGAYGSAVAVGEHLYYAAFVTPSPVTDLAYVLRYDPAADRWDYLPSTREAHGGGELWSDGEQLFIAGGGWSSYRSDVEAYDLAQGLLGGWVVTPGMAEGRRTFALARDADSGLVYAAGGWDGDFMRSVEVATGEHLRQ